MKKLFIRLAAVLINSRFFWGIAFFFSSLILFFRKQTKLLVLKGFSLEKRGNNLQAAEYYDKAAVIGETSEKNDDVRWLHAACFFLERSFYKAGKGRAEDPLFSCSFKGLNKQNIEKAEGIFTAEFVFSGILLAGILPPSGIKESGSRVLEVFLEGIKIREITVTEGRFFGRFTLKILRQTLCLFPFVSSLTVKLKNGKPLLLPDNSGALEIMVPHGTGNLFSLLKAGGKIDKKGGITPPDKEIREKQALYLKLYDRVRWFLEKETDRQLFLIHGTLLGFYREGDFIKGDDDFDVAYMSDRNDPDSVKNEALEIISILVTGGFSVSFNRKGRLFRIFDEKTAPKNIHLDVHTVWVEGEKIWAPLDYSEQGKRGDFVPAKSGVMRGIKVYYPAKAEYFLLKHYGEGWKVPDPGFNNYLSRPDKGVIKTLSRLFITPYEYRILKKKFVSEKEKHPEHGDFISIGIEKLYPLSDQDIDLD